MSNEEMQKAMEFIVRIDRQTTIKLERLGIKAGGIRGTQSRSEKRWQQTEKRIRALLARAKKREREMAAQRRRRRLPLSKNATDKRLKTATDRRLKALANLVERQVSERRNGKQ